MLRTILADKSYDLAAVLVFLVFIAQLSTHINDFDDFYASLFFSKALLVMPITISICTVVANICSLLA